MIRFRRILKKKNADGCAANDTLVLIFCIYDFSDEISLPIFIGIHTCIIGRSVGGKAKYS